MTLEKLIEEARKEAEQDIDQFCLERGLIFKTRKHKWSQWEENGGYMEGNSSASLWYERECKICGWPQMRRIKF